jgi:hypothetical protein
VTFGLAFACGGARFGFGFAVDVGFAVDLGGVEEVRDEVLGVVTGRGAGVGVAAGGGVAATTRRFGAAGAVEATTGASGVGTARVDFTGADDCDRLEGFEAFEDFVDVVANPPGGSSGAGIGVPPAAHPAAGQTNATRQAPIATGSRLSRRDDVHPDTTSPLSEPPGTSVDARVTIRAGWPPMFGGHPCLLH